MPNKLRVLLGATGVVLLFIFTWVGISPSKGWKNVEPVRTATVTPSPPFITKSKPAELDRSVMPNSFRENLNGVSLEMIEVPAGKFTMGSDQSDYEKPPHQVSVQSFYMGKYEVTQKQWKAVMGNNPSYIEGDDLPVGNVSWDEAQAFCKKLQELTGKAYRLPSEAEWEYACRAGTTGDYAGNLYEMAWYDKNSDSKTHPVGQKQKNAFGLFDMHGNVWEWCEDVWHGNYNDAPKDGSVWTSGGNSKGHVRRGGSYAYGAWNCRAASRSYSTPDDHRLYSRDADVGIRCVISARTL